MRTTGLLVVLSAFLLAASALGAPGLKPIKETFTLLPCPAKPTTTLELEGCAEHRIVASDKKIDAAAARIYSTLSAEGKGSFVSAQNAWLVYRRAYCLTASSVFAGGSIQPVVFGNCVADRNGSYLGELTALVAALKNP